MNKQTTIKLPFFETVKRSLLYVFFNFKSFLKISTASFILFALYQALMGAPATCTISGQDCSSDLSNVLSLLLMIFFMVVVGVAYCRFVILKEESFLHLRFGKIELQYIGQLLIIYCLLMLSAFALFMAASLIFQLGGIKIIAEVFSLLLFLSLFSVICLIGRFCIALPAAAVGNSTFTLEKAWLLTSGNTFRIFGGLVLTGIPGALFAIFVVAIYQYIQPEDFLGSLTFAILSIVINFFDLALRSSFLSHAYQYFMYFDNKPSVETSQVLAKKVEDKPKSTTKKAQTKKPTAKKSTPKLKKTNRKKVLDI